MKPIDYWLSLSTEDAQTAYAIRAGSSFHYLNKHIFRKSGRSRNPSWKLLINLAQASEEKVSLDEAIDYFLVQPVKEMALGMQSSCQPTPAMSRVKNKGFDGVSEDNSALLAG